MNTDSIWYFLLFIAITLFVYCILTAKKQPEQSHVDYPAWVTLILPLIELFSKEIGDFFEKKLYRWSHWINQKCGEAGYPWHAADIYGMQLALLFIVISFALAIWALTGFMFVFLLPTFLTILAISIAFPIFFIWHQAQERLFKISKIMPFAIDLICAAMNAGLDFLGAVRYYTKLNFQDPLSHEFLVLLREIELGKTRSEALRNMEQRVHSAEFTRFTSSVIYSLESGTAIIEVMQLQADEVRRIRFAKTEQQIAKVPSKMLIPIVLFIVPGVFIIVLTPLVMKMKDIGIFSAIFK